MLTDAEPSPLEAFLRACSVVAPDEESGPLLRQSAALVSCWDALPSDAASHGLTALVLRHACAWNVQLPRSVRRQMDVHLLRQHAQQAAQYEVLREIADAFTLLGIAYVVLKGPVLAHAIYPDPRLRSMSDLDILVRMVDIQRVQGVLQALGFGSPRSLGPVRPHAHHHLPPLQLCRHGETVTVEVHVSAVSRDQGGRLALDANREPLRQIPFGQREMPAFGHIDMLTHLTAHLLEPAERTRLRDVAELAVVDLREHVQHALLVVRILGEVTPDRAELVRAADAVVREVLAESPDAILFIDEIHLLTGSGGSTDHHDDVGQLLKPALAALDDPYPEIGDLVADHDAGAGLALMLVTGDAHGPPFDAAPAGGREVWPNL